MITITCRHMEHSEALDAYARQNLSKLDKFLTHQTDIHIDLVIEFLPVHAHHNVELRVNTPKINLISHDEGPDLYILVDNVIKKMEHELRKHEEKELEKRNHSGRERIIKL